MPHHFLRGGSASLILGLAKQQNDSTKISCFLLQQLDNVIDRVQDGCAVVTSYRMGEGIFHSIGPGRKMPCCPGTAIERHQHDLVSRLADHGIEQFRELTVVPKLARIRAARLHEDHHGDGSIPGLFERHLLPDSVVEEFYLIAHPNA